MDNIYYYVGYVVCCAASVSVGFSLLSFVLNRLTTPSIDYRREHVFVTGGSTGLGFAFAALARRRGARVSILSRNPQRLEAARRRLLEITCDTDEDGEKYVFGVAADVCDAQAVREALDAAARHHHRRPPTFLVTSAGLSHPAFIEDLSIETFEQEMRLNYMGTVNAVKSTLALHEDDSKGASSQPLRLVMVSSAAAFFAFGGFAAYCPTKYAVRGFAEALRNEMLRHNAEGRRIDVHCYYPASLDTPGFAEEQRTKPQATKEIEGSTTLLTADEAAAALDVGVRRRQFHITSDLLGELGRIGTNGLTPRNNFFFELLLTPLMPLLQLVFVYVFDSTMAKARDDEKKKSK